MPIDAARPGRELARAVESLLRVEPTRMALLIDRLRAPGRTVESTVKGMSMGRGLPPGSLIRIELVSHKCFTAGTIIAFLAGDTVVVHRVLHAGPLGVGANLILTRGDLPLVPDQPVAHSRILGPVTGVWLNGQWQAPPPEPGRTAHGRLISSMLLLLTLSTLRLSTRATSTMLGRLRQLERVARQVRTRAAFLWRRQAPGPG